MKVASPHTLHGRHKHNRAVQLVFFIALAHPASPSQSNAQHAQCVLWHAQRYEST